MKAFCSALLALCLAFKVGEARESLPMRSLHCYNDYTSQITCTWQECTAARRFLNVTLHHQDNLDNKNMQIPCEPQVAEELPVCQDFCVFWSCRKNSTKFAIGGEDIYTFKPDRELQVQLNISLFQNGSRYVSPSDFSLEDEAQPKNLSCLFNGVDRLMCSWEVRREVTSSVLFTLFYRATPASEETECSPVQEEELPRSLYVLHSCEINVTDPSELSQYLITVRPKKEEKLIEAYKNIKPHAPVNVTMTKIKDQKYELRWTKQNLSDNSMRQRYEFRYWKTGDTLETAPGVNISSDEPPFIFTPKIPESSTTYMGKMRARVHHSTYKGPWSEWSEECSWETESGTSQLGYRIGALVGGGHSLPREKGPLAGASYN